MLFIIPYNKTNGAATTLATPSPMSPRKNITTIRPTQDAVILTPSSKLKGITKSPIAEKANSISHKCIKAHLSFQYIKPTTKQERINNRYVIGNSFFA